MDDNKKYWDERAKNIGHTGWSNEIVYAFDQKVRIEIVKEILNNNIDVERLSCAKVLDFGGGDGTFAEALAPLVREYTYYDLSTEITKIAKKRLSRFNNVKYANDKNQLLTCDESFDFILVVTVFQHIIDNNELVDTLKMLNKKLSSKGKLVVLEDTFAKNNDVNTYIHFRTVDEFESILKMGGFLEFKSKGFYHPFEKPTNGFDNYYKNLFVRAYRKIKKKSKGKIVLPINFKKIAVKYIGNVSDYLFEAGTDDVSRIYICDK